MTIPPLINGVLPPGTYATTLGEVRADFDQPGSRAVGLERSAGAGCGPHLIPGGDSNPLRHRRDRSPELAIAGHRESR